MSARYSQNEMSAATSHNQPSNCSRISADLLIREVMDCTEGNVPSTMPRGSVIASTLDIGGAAVIGHNQIDSRAEVWAARC